METNWIIGITVGSLGLMVFALLAVILYQFRVISQMADRIMSYSPTATQNRTQLIRAGKPAPTSALQETPAGITEALPDDPSDEDLDKMFPDRTNVV